MIMQFKRDNKLLNNNKINSFENFNYWEEVHMWEWIPYVLAMLCFLLKFNVDYRQEVEDDLSF